MLNKLKHLNMNWYIGQHIIAIENANRGEFKKGSTHIIMGLHLTPCCNKVIIDIGVPNFGLSSHVNCVRCGGIYPDSYNGFSEIRFAPIDLDISELTDILEKPLELVQP